MKLFYICMALFLSFQLHLFALELPDEAKSFSWDKPGVVENSLRSDICLNGLWKFFPFAGKEDIATIPEPEMPGWGWFKVPGVWPGHYSTKNPFAAYLSAAQLKDAKKWHSAWYQRTFKIPQSRKGSKVLLDIEHVQTFASIFIDGKKAGTIQFPGGSLDITGLIEFGKVQNLSILVRAIPSSGSDYIIMDTHNVYKVAAKIKIKGIVGDVFFRVVPSTRIEATHLITSVRKKSISFDCVLKGLDARQNYQIEAEIKKAEQTVKKFSSKKFKRSDLKDGRYLFTASWENPELWDTHTPQNIYTAVLRLKSSNTTLDITIGEKFGFREFWIDGQNYMLNNSPIHLMAYHLGTYTNFWGSDKSSEKSCMTTFARLKKLGFNFFITSNYNFSEGKTAYIRGTYEAADKSGTLSSFSLPHPRHFDWKLDNPAVLAKYRKLTTYLIRKYWNHPSIVMFASTHNSTSAWGDQNPLRIGQDYKPASNANERRIKEPNRKNAQIVMKCVSQIDPSRPVYAHASGSLCGNYTLNMYLNWAPKQERSDWLEDYFHKGRYPLAVVEWGLPHIASFSSFRGPGFIWHVAARQTVWDAEYIAASKGDSSTVWTRTRTKVLDKLIKLGNEPYKWGKVYGSLKRLKDVINLQADFYEDNLRCLRAWNISMLLPWDDYANYIYVNGKYPPVENKDRFKNLNRPGVVPDYFRHDGYVYTPYENSYKLSKLGQVIRRWNRPLIAFIGGAKVFTTKEHIYHAGTNVKKTLVILNDTRTPVNCKYEIWAKNVQTRGVKGNVKIQPGSRALVPVKLKLPKNLTSGKYQLQSKYLFSDGSKRWDQFDIHVIADENSIEKLDHDFALYDPKGLTAKYLTKLGVKYHKVSIDENLEKYKTLIIGREALSATDPLPNLNAVKSGLKVLVFEQSNAALNRLGFRTNEHGLRNLFARNKQHPILDGLNNNIFMNWSGASTLLPKYIDYQDFYAPEWKWCGFKNTRVWRSSNRGNIASVLIEKPSVGNFTPLLDGGFALQYSPLLEYREGAGKIIFCQLDVTARTDTSPAADLITRRILKYISNSPENKYKSFYLCSGESFSKFISSLNINISRNLPDMNASGKSKVIVAGPGLDKYPSLDNWIKSGNTLICIGLGVSALQQLCPTMKDLTEKKNAVSTPVDLSSKEFAGISNLDTYFQSRLNYTVIDSRGKQLQKIAYGKGTIIICSVMPEALDYKKLFRLRSSFRRRVFLVSQLLRNAGASGSSELLQRFKEKAGASLWLNSYYIQEPIAEDDPYRYYHW